MRPYDREDYRHLTDSERYRDIEYLADDAYVGPNERIAYGMTRDDREARAARGQERGPERGLGYGRPYDESDLERSRQDPYEQRAEAGAERPHPLRGAYDRPDVREGGIGAYLRHPGRLVDAAKGLFRGKGPKNWSRSDTRIHDDVCERLALNPEIDASEIEVTVKDGEVTLAGLIDDRRLRWLAEDIAGDVLGVHDVHNRLRLRQGVREPENPLQGYGTHGMQRTASSGTGAPSTTGGVRR